MMKFSVVVLLALVLTTGFGCRKKTYKPILTDALITGYDYRKCACCGGLMITFSNDSIPYNSPFKLISNPVAYFGFTDSTPYPVRIKVNATNDPVRCPGTYVKIRSFELP